MDKDQNQIQPPKPKRTIRWRGFPKVQPCDKCHRDYQANCPVSLYCKDCQKEKRTEYSANYDRRKKMKVGRPIKLSTKPPEFCYWCLGSCKVDETCPDCGTPYDANKALSALHRQTASYLDIVAQNAKKKGRSPQEEIKRIRNLRVNGSYGNGQLWKDINHVLSAYLKKRGYRSMYNGVVIKIKPKSKIKQRGEL